jgi:hypothetical protein
MAVFLSPGVVTRLARGNSTQGPKTGFKTGTVHKPESGIVSPQSSLILEEGTDWHKGRERQITDERAFVDKGLFPLDEHSKFQSGWFPLSLYGRATAPTQMSTRILNSNTKAQQ